MILDKAGDDYVKLLLNEYEQYPTNCKYDNIVHPPYGDSILPKLFFWCPTSHYSIELNCPIHNILMKPGMWTDDLVTPNSVKNPRLMFDMFGNVVLIQRYYNCNPENDKSHRYCSTDQELLKMLPSEIIGRFCFRKYNDSAFSINLTTFLFEQVKRGVNFSQIAEAIAMFNHTEFERLKSCHISTTLKDLSFTESKLFSFPSSDRLISLFIDVYKKQEQFFKDEMEKIPSTSMISTDHTFKIGKPIGYYCGDKFVHNYGKLFIVLNEDHQVLAWQLCKTAGHAEVEDLLLNLAKRKGSHHIKTVLVDNCCAERRFYEICFFGCSVKLDIFHAIQRLVKDIPHRFSFRGCKYSSSVGLIVRQSMDMDFIRTMVTPAPDVIKNNLERFLECNKDFIESLEINRRMKVKEEIRKLSVHIENGCLSGIMPGQGTEANERLHRVINRSMITGSTNISPELAKAILAVIFHYFNEKSNQERHLCNKKIHITNPLPNTSIATELTKVSQIQSATINTTLIKQHIMGDNAIQKNEIVDFLTIEIIKTHQAFVNLSSTCFRKDMTFTSLLLNGLNYEPNSIVTANSYVEENLKGFKLQSSSTLFDSIWRLLASHLVYGEYEQKVDGLCLTDISDCEEQLKLFITGYIETNDSRFYLVPNSTKITEYCTVHKIFLSFADLIKKTIIVVLPESDMQCNVYIPNLEHDDNSLVFFARNKDNKFLATDQYQLGAELSSSVHCKCGKNSNQSCIKSKNTRCPCVLQNLVCKEKCSCRKSNCLNTDNERSLLPSSNIVFKSCRCGSGKKKIEGDELKSCGDVDSKYKSRCPCFNFNNGCSERCMCVGCVNKFGKKVKLVSGDIVNRKRRHDTTFNRFKNKEEQESTIVWSNIDTVAVIMIMKITKNQPESCNIEDVSIIYNMLVSNRLNLSQRSKKSIAAKLMYLGQAI